MIDQGLVEKIDANQMENFKNVLGPFQTLSVDEDRSYSAPYMWGTTGFTYDPEMVPGGELEESWKELFEPRDELKGNIAMLNEMSDVWNAAAYYVGCSARLGARELFGGTDVPGVAGGPAVEYVYGRSY